MKRISTISLAAIVAASLLQLPPASAAQTPHITGAQTQEIADSYDHLTKEFYRKVDPQTVLDSVHKELIAALVHEHLKATLPVALASDNETTEDREIDLQV